MHEGVVSFQKEIMVKTAKFPQKMQLSLLLGACGLLLCSGSFAQQSLPSVDEIVRKLTPSAGARIVRPEVARPKKRTRGLVLDDDAPEAAAVEPVSNAGNASTSAAAPIANSQGNATVLQNSGASQAQPAKAPIAAAPAAGEQGGKISESRITFEFGSDRLTPYAKRVLDVFGAAIQSPQLQNVNFVIEGHTDGTGSDQYNLDLSRKRAEAVIRYLVDVVAVDSARLAARGKGRRELVNPDDPAAAENRRVVWTSQR